MTGARPFEPARTAARRHALAEVLAAEPDGAALLVGDPLDVRYLTGFQGTNAALLVLDGEPRLVTDTRYAAPAQATGLPVRLAPGPAAAAAMELLPPHRPVLVDPDATTAGQWVRFAAARPAARLAPSPTAVLRQRKDDAERAAIAEAVADSERVLLGLLADGVAGRTERELARTLEHGFAEGAAFPAIVAAGEHSAVPHHVPTDRPVRRGDLLKIDFGGRSAGYCADLTRTFVVGAAAGWQRDLYAVVLAAQQAGRAAVLAGAAIAEVDAAARTVIADAGLGDCFGHGLGHGLGLAVHEQPILAARSAGTLADGMAITIEPGVYLPGRGGVRIEDTVLVTPQGHRNLVTLPHDLVVVD
jgi:Xaa-Pro aminopeptidase